MDATEGAGRGARFPPAGGRGTVRWPGAPPGRDPVTEAGHDHARARGHAHGQGHAHGAGTATRGGQRRALLVALVANGAFLVAEVVGGIAFNSLALLADAAHMASD